MPDADVDVAWVPGGFEIPMTAKRLARSGRYAAVICLGCLIQGDTPHFHYVAGEVTKGIAQVSLETGVPVVFGVVTAETLDQAIERAGHEGGEQGIRRGDDGARDDRPVRRTRRIGPPVGPRSCRAPFSRRTGGSLSAVVR